MVWWFVVRVSKSNFYENLIKKVLTLIHPYVFSPCIVEQARLSMMRHIIITFWMGKFDDWPVM